MNTYKVVWVKGYTMEVEAESEAIAKKVAEEEYYRGNLAAEIELRSEYATLITKQEVTTS